jgi:hypothetical protein
MDSEDQITATALRVSTITGTVAIAVSAVVGLILTVALSRWENALPAVVPVALAGAAVATGPRRSPGRRLGWIALVVLGAGIAAGLIFQSTSDPYG